MVQKLGTYGRPSNDQIDGSSHPRRIVRSLWDGIRRQPASDCERSRRSRTRRDGCCRRPPHSQSGIERVRIEDELATLSSRGKPRGCAPVRRRPLRIASEATSRRPLTVSRPGTLWGTCSGGLTTMSRSLKRSPTCIALLINPLPISQGKVHRPRIGVAKLFAFSHPGIEG